MGEEVDGAAIRNGCPALMRCENEANGKFEPLDFRLTIGLRKLSNQWTVLHEHHSIPARS